MSFDTQFFDELARGIADFYGQKPFGSAAAADAAIEDLQALEARAEDHGLTKLQPEGGDRIAFRSTGGDYVVKVSKSDGSMQNAEAVGVWQEMDAEARKCVAPLVTWAEDRRWIVQKWAQPTAGGAAQVVENLHEAGWTCSDVDGGNVGVYDGRHVLIDLGVGLRRL